MLKNYFQYYFNPQKSGLGNLIYELSGTSQL